jgi:hypothetical protein
MKLLYVHEVLLLAIHREYLVGLLTADNRRPPPIIAKAFGQVLYIKNTKKIQITKKTTRKQ